MQIRPAARLFALALVALTATLVACDDAPSGENTDLLDDGSAVFDGESDSGFDAPETSLDMTVASDAPETVDPPDVGPDVAPMPNPCGGMDALDHEGAPAAPGETCGACDDGRLICDGAEALRCAGARALDACGGCSGLVVALGDGCGTCQSGTWSCTGTDLSCADDGGLNACGGCLVLGGAPGDACDDGAGPGTLACGSTEALACVALGTNICGGTQPLPDTLLRPCGECALGVLECSGTDDVACVGDGPRNACGGCNDLPLLGTACGECGGEWDCHPSNPDALVCVSQRADACGGCTENDALPGTACDDGDGIWACDPVAGLSCAAPGDNGCGGSAPLPAAPGESCGECGDGTYACTGTNALACLGASVANACGGCGLLPAELGARCGPLGFVWACDGAGTLECVADDLVVVVGLEVVPSAISVAVGASVQLSATAAWSDGSTSDATSIAVWTALDAGIVDVSAGLATGLAEGASTITATFDGVMASAAVTVTADVTPPALVEVRVSPATATLQIGGTVALSAEAVYDDASTADVTATAVWASAAPAIATVDAAGNVGAVAPGAAGISATFDGLVGTSTITIDPPVPVSLEVSPSLVFAGVGDTVVFTATATYADASTADVSAQAVWTSSAPAVASVAAGSASALTPGIASIGAELQGASDQATLDIGPVVTGLSSDLPTVDVSVGARLRPTVTATFSDASTLDVSALLVWSSADPGVGAGQADGWVEATGPGSTSLSASYRGVAVTLGLDVRALDTYRGSQTETYTFMPAVQDTYRGSQVEAYTFMPAVQDTYRNSEATSAVTWQ